MTSLAEKMFSAYNEQGPNPWQTFDGRNVPQWHELNDQVRAKWQAAAAVAAGIEDEVVANTPKSGLKFGGALFHLERGDRVARAGWNGKGMWLALSPGAKALPAEKFWAGPNRAYAESSGGAADVLPCITMKTATGEILMGWLASQSDMLAEDWIVVT